MKLSEIVTEEKNENEWDLEKIERVMKIADKLLDKLSKMRSMNQNTSAPQNSFSPAPSSPPSPQKTMNPEFIFKLMIGFMENIIEQGYGDISIKEAHAFLKSNKSLVMKEIEKIIQE